jgi:NAD-dependent dihydropyrimidine dehydrogenase PreA subunit
VSTGEFNPAEAGTPHHGLFIAVEVDDSVAGDRELAAKLAEVCPVDIFAAGEQGVEIVDPHLDECVLCQLCINAAPVGTIRVIKLYDDGAVLGA